MKLDQRYAALSPDKRKLVLFVLAIVVAIGFLMMPSPSALRRALTSVGRLYPGTQAVKPVKPSPYDGQGYIPPPASEAIKPALGLPTPGALLGTWAGRGLLPKRGVCTLTVELRGQAGEQGPVVGYSTFQCMNLQMLMPGARGAGAKPVTPESVMAATGSLTPVSSVLSGIWEGGAIRFQVDKTIGGNPAEGCDPKSAVVTPFGMRQVAFEGIDAVCGHYQILLNKAGM